jgi:ankyrin repeat protein
MIDFWSTYFNTHIDFYQICYSECVELIECLLEEIRSERNIDVMNNGLYGACARGDTHIVRMLVNSGASDLNGGLQRASISDNLGVVKFLVSNGATDLNCALREACLFGYEDIVVYLLENGANHVSSLSCACYGCHVDIVRILLDYGVGDWENGFSEACVQSNNREIVDLFLERYKCSQKQLCLFESACYNRWVDLICLTISNSYDKELLVNYWEFLDVFEPSSKDRVVNVQVKMFDKNLFGCISKSCQNKRKRKYE